MSLRTPLSRALGLGSAGDGTAHWWQQRVTAVALALLGLWFAFFYHLCNGIRHLWWDSGRGFEIAQVYRSGWIVLLAAAALTLVAWGLLLSGGGA
jgi:succinate dehydrogenase cytochrome b556 subunit